MLACVSAAATILLSSIFSQFVILDVSTANTLPVSCEYGCTPFF